MNNVFVTILISRFGGEYPLYISLIARFGEILIYFIATYYVLNIVVNKKKYISFYKAWQKQFMLIGTSVFFTWVTVNILKVLLSHPRPYLVNPEILPLYTIGGLDSFPSGHAAVLLAISLLVFYFHKKIGTALIFFSTIVAVARIASGIHYVYDVLAGWILALLIFLFVSRLIYVVYGPWIVEKKGLKE